jgi:hypothetical protein
VAAIRAVASYPPRHVFPAARSRWFGAQQIANGNDVILLNRVSGEAIRPGDTASDAAVNNHQPFS